MPPFPDPIRILAAVALALALGACSASAGNPGGPMRKQDAVPPVFEPGPVASPGPELDAWLATHADAHVRLPFTVWRGPLGSAEIAAVGVHEARPEAGLRLADSALGVSLADRLRALCGEEPRCVVTLSGRFGELAPALTVPADDAVFSVLAVYGRVTGEAPRAEVERRPE